MKCPVLVERFRLDNLREPVLRVISLSLLISNNIDKKAASTFNASVVEEMTSELKKTSTENSKRPPDVQSWAFSKDEGNAGVYKIQIYFVCCLVLRK